MMRRVLVVDDEPSVRSSLAGFLEDSDCSVMIAASAEEALALLNDHLFDVAIVDLRLPGMNGDALILEAYARQPHLHFLIHTGSVSFRLSDELRRIGITQAQVFLKPVADLNLLARGIEQVLATADAERAGPPPTAGPLPDRRTASLP